MSAPNASATASVTTTSASEYDGCFEYGKVAHERTISLIEAFKDDAAKKGAKDGDDFPLYTKANDNIICITVGRNGFNVKDKFKKLSDEVGSIVSEAVTKYAHTYGKHTFKYLNALVAREVVDKLSADGNVDPEALEALALLHGFADGLDAIKNGTGFCHPSGCIEIVGNAKRAGTLRL
jgi:hypothetical protein